MVYIPPYIKLKLTKYRPLLIKSLKASVETFKTIDSLYATRVSLNAIKHSNKLNTDQMRTNIQSLSTKLTFIEASRSSQLLLPVTPFATYKKSTPQTVPPTPLKPPRTPLTSSVTNSFSKEYAQPQL